MNQLGNKNIMAQQHSIKSRNYLELPGLISGLRPHSLYQTMGHYPYSLLSTTDVPQFSPW